MIAQEKNLEPLEPRRHCALENLFYKVLEPTTDIAQLYLCYKVLVHKKF